MHGHHDSRGMPARSNPYGHVDVPLSRHAIDLFEMVLHPQALNGICGTAQVSSWQTHPATVTRQEL